MSISLQRFLSRLLVVALLALVAVVLQPVGATRAEAAPATSTTVELEELEAPAGEAGSTLGDAAGAPRPRPSADDEPSAVAEGPEQPEEPDGFEPAWIVSEPEELPDTVMIGVEVGGEAQPAVEARAFEEGQWSEWVPLPFPDEADGPDPGTPESEAERNTTEPMWIGEATGVQVRVDGEVVGFDDVLLHTVDIEGSIEFDPLAPQVGAANASTALDIIPRSSWDPNNECAPRSAPSIASDARFTVIHHTASSNSYTQAQAATQVRSICLFHRNSRGWSDIGYNIMVDRYGRIYEGRAGGLERAVVGAHAANYNTGSFGVGVMGCFDTSCSSSLGSITLPSAALSAVDRVVAWKFVLHGIDPFGRISYNSQTLDTIVGHRDVGSTSCPGNQFTPFVRGTSPMKNRVAPLMDGFRTPSPAPEPAPPPPPPAPDNVQPWDLTAVGDANGSGRPDLVNYEPGTGRWWVNTAADNGFTQATWARFSTRTGWSAHVTGDFTGNGRVDTASFHPSNGSWWVNRSTGSNYTTERWASGWTSTGWAPPLVGDFTGNGRDEIASFHPSNGAWWVSRSTGSSFQSTVWDTFGTRTGWQARLVGDFNGDGRDDIASYHPGSGTWWVSESSGSSFRHSLWARWVTTEGWGPFLVGDFTGDGRDDIAVYHRSNGRWWVSRFEDGRFRWRVWDEFSGRNGWGAHLVGDFTGNGRADIASYHPANGTWWVSRSNGWKFDTAHWSTMTAPADWNRFVVGDFNADGRDDVATYRATDRTWWVGRSDAARFTHESWTR
jgi:hypothetical protein